MQAPVPQGPTISSDQQVDCLQVNKTTTNLISNYASGRGTKTTIPGQNKTYSASSVAGGIIIRTETTETPSNDRLPDVDDLVAELGLIAENGASYCRMLAIYNFETYRIDLSGSGWGFANVNQLTGFNSYTFFYIIWYTDIDGWQGDITCSGSIDLS